MESTPTAAASVRVLKMRLQCLGALKGAGLPRASPCGTPLKLTAALCVTTEVIIVTCDATRSLSDCK